MPKPLQLSVVMIENGSMPRTLQSLSEHIQSRAQEIFLQRGPQDGHDVDDWLTAEQEFVYRPAAELIETEKDFVITLTVPGSAAKDLQVDVAVDAVMIKGGTVGAAEDEDNEGRVLFSELRGKPIYRKFDLPSDIDPKKVAATLNDGMLRIVAKKSERQVSEQTAAANA